MYVPSALHNFANLSFLNLPLFTSTYLWQSDVAFKILAVIGILFLVASIRTPLH